MTDINNREIIIGDTVIVKKSYSDRFEKTTVTGFTPKRIKVRGMSYTNEEFDRTVIYALVVTDKPADIVDFMLEGLNKLV